MRSLNTSDIHILAGDNLGLIFMREAAVEVAYNHVLVTTNLIDNGAFFSNKGIMQIAPLYLYHLSIMAAAGLSMLGILNMKVLALSGLH